MSSDLHDLFKDELREIPLRPPETWVPASTVRTPRRQLRWLGPALAVIAVVIASIGAGELIVGLRERLAPASSTSSGLPALREGHDLVYLAEGDAAKGYLQVLQMPEGQIAARYVGRSIVGSYIDRYAMRTGDDLAFLPVWDEVRPGGTADTYLQAVVLRSGAPTFRIPTGQVSVSPTTAAGAVEVAGPFVGEVAVSTDGSSVFLVRDIGPGSRTTQLVRYDARYDPQTNAPSPTAGRVIASKTWTGGPSDDPVWSRVIPLDGARVALVRQHVQGTDMLGRATHLGQDWYFLDGGLNEIASYTGDRRFGPTATCSFDPIPLSNGEWALICADPTGAAFENIVYFLDGRDFHVVATVPISRELGFLLGATVSADGKLSVLTNRPLVVRYDIQQHRMIDRRPVTAISLLDRMAPSVALAKDTGGPTIQFTPDGRFAYVATDRAAWWGGLAVIDLQRAALVTHSTGIGDSVVALKLSAEGHRLYALTADGNGRTTLVLLDPATLRVIQRTTPLENAPRVFVAVAQRQ